MIHGLLLRWIVTGLFAVTAVECALPIVIQRRPWTSVVSHGFHVAMAVGMAAMAWPWSAQLPALGPAVFFLLAAVWFVAMAIGTARATRLGPLYTYHSLMMLATAWMYVTMNGGVSPASGPGMSMAGMNMSPGSESPTWFGAVNWLGTVTFAIAAAFWTYRYVIDRQRTRARFGSLGKLDQAMMAAGMAILFVATLFRI